MQQGDNHGELAESIAERDARLVAPTTDYMDQGADPKPDHAGLSTGMLVGMSPGWEPVVTLGGQAQIVHPGWSITRMWATMYQAIAESSKYRFCGQGTTPGEALEDARKQMITFRDELDKHLETY